MRHRIGRPVLKDRTFPVLQMTCATMETDAGADGVDDAAAVSRREKPEFLVVSITVDDYFSSGFAPSSSSSPSSAPTPGPGGDTVVAAYVSVERIRRLDDGDSGAIEWIMATASDARGVLPMWMQTLAVPAQIAKDVPLFLAWIEKQRSS